MKKVGWLILAVIFGIFLRGISFSSPEEDLFIKGTQGNIVYLNGGIGKEERDLLNEAGIAYSLKLIFSNKEGQYISDVLLKVLNQKEQVIFSLNSKGPWLLIDLPPGIYTLEANYKEVQKIKTDINVKKGSQKTVEIQW